jgi:hypothetical protein
LWERSFSFYANELQIDGAYTQAWIVGSGDVAALPKGQLIGPRRNFLRPPGQSLMACHFCNSAGFCSTKGPWIDVKDRYVGLRFEIDAIGGKVHYGWARLSVSYDKKNCSLQSVLTGYAYETIPNQPIITGKTKGPDVIAIQEGSLGHLAQRPSSSGGKYSQPGTTDWAASDLSRSVVSVFPRGTTEAHLYT